MVPCARLGRLRDGARATVAGLVLVRQKPGSAKGVLFITLEDETEVANLVVWPALFARQRNLILSAGMMAAAAAGSARGRCDPPRREHLIDLSDLLADVGRRGVMEERPDAARGRHPDQDADFR